MWKIKFILHFDIIYLCAGCYLSFVVLLAMSGRAYELCRCCSNTAHWELHRNIGVFTEGISVHWSGCIQIDFNNRLIVGGHILMCIAVLWWCMTVLSGVITIQKELFVIFFPSSSYIYLHHYYSWSPRYLKWFLKTVLSNVAASSSRCTKDDGFLLVLLCCLGSFCLFVLLPVLIPDWIDDMRGM